MDSGLVVTMSDTVEPVKMLLFCPSPSCGEQHVDEGEWAVRPHKTHLCLVCGCEWRPFDFPTVGVYL